jgi:glycosyltransferase involved in cell wall biosynthesis
MPFKNAAERLGCRLTADLPQPIDTSIFKPAGQGEEFSDGFKGLTIFHPTRMMFTYDPFLVDTGQWKGNDRLFRGFAGAVDNGVDARLILIERSGSPDQELAEHLIDELGLSGLVTWLRSTTSAGYTWRELAYLYRSSDLVVDTLGGLPGLVSLEALSCGRPVLNQVDEDVMALIHPDGHPYLQAYTEEDVRDAISMLTDHERRASIGDAGRRWVLDNHDRDIVARRCESMLEVL